MAIAFLVGRIIFGLVILMNGANHFMQLETMTGYAASKGVPSPKLAVLGAGVLLLVGALSILTGFQPLIGIVALVIFFIPVTFKMHNFWTIEDEQMKMMDMTQFMKNMALLGATLMFLAIPQPWPFGLG